jgi:hypothetical protein
VRSLLVLLYGISDLLQIRFAIRVSQMRSTLQSLIEARTCRQTPHARLEHRLRHDRPRMAAALHCLERHKQDVQRHLQVHHTNPHARQRKNRGQHVRLLQEDLVGQDHLLYLDHAVDVDVGLGHHGPAVHLCESAPASQRQQCVEQRESDRPSAATAPAAKRLRLVDINGD